MYNTNYVLKDFDINKIDKKFFNESERLLPKNNYVGFSITQGNVYRKKNGLLKIFLNAVKSLKKKIKYLYF